MTPPPNTNDAPTKKPKNGRFCPTRVGFWVSVAGHRGFWEEGSFHFRIPQHIRRTQLVRKVFWKIHLRTEIWGRFISPFEVTSETTQRSIFRGRNWKIGGQSFAQQFFVAPLLESKFNVGHDFAIKHDPIQSESDDWVIDFCAMPKSCWAPKISIIP